jgi:hypothetical protein
MPTEPALVPDHLLPGSVMFGTGYHIQDTDTYCAAAVAQIILGFELTRLDPIAQPLLYEMNREHTRYPQGYYTDPWGLAYTLTNYTAPSRWEPILADTGTLGTELLLAAMRGPSGTGAGGAPTAAMVFKGKHWVTLCGITPPVQDKNPRQEKSGGLWIQNPWPSSSPPPKGRLPPPPPPPHCGTKRSDINPKTGGMPDCCGVGPRGTLMQWVSYPQWLQIYFTAFQFEEGAPRQVAGVGRQRSLFTLVNGQGAEGRPDVASQAIPPSAGTSISSKGATPMLSAREAAQCTTKELAAHRLDQHPLFAGCHPIGTDAIDVDAASRKADVTDKTGVVPAVLPPDVLFVEPLDEQTSPYYLVPLERGDRIAALACVDAQSGDLLEVGGCAEQDPLLSASQIIQLLEGKTIDLGDGSAPLVFTPGHFTIAARLVWRPTEESRSPLYPFYVVDCEKRRIYVGLNGSILPELPPLGRPA